MAAPEFLTPLIPGRFRRNPVVMKELRGRMRGGKAFVILTIYLLLLSIAISIVFLAFTASQNPVGSSDVRQVLGKAIFGMVVGMELFTVSFIAPALTSSAISSEREHQTFDLLRTTLLSARSFVLGKLFSSLFYIVLLLFAALPLQSLAFLLGGVAIEEVLIGNLLLVITATAFSAIGLFFSSITRRTLVSTVLSYALAIIIVFGLPVFLLTGIALFDRMLFGSGLPANVIAESILVVSGWVIVSLNPLATAVVTQIILIEEQSAFYFAFPLGNGNTVPVLSPWISYAVIYLFLSSIMVWLSVRFVKRVDR
jgi:ABC-type transport system involved in multi-copper enzyme maturation permease subunit